MKKAKIIKQVKEKEENNIVKEEAYSIKTLILIVLILVLIFAFFYFITTLVVKNNKTITNTSSSTTVIDTAKIMVSQLLDRSEDEYYVIATKPSLYEGQIIKTNYIQIYSRYIRDYGNKENSLKFYSINLDDALNRNYIGDSSNISDNLEELVISDEILFKIKDKKVENYYLGREAIIQALSQM